MNHADARVLIVDDDRLLRRLLQRLLVDAGFSQVDEAENGLVALTRLRAVAYDVVVTDWEMPALDGRGLLRAVREWPARCRTPVLILSGSSPDGPDPALANALLAKPFEPDALLDAVERLLTAPSGRTEAQGRTPERTTPCK